MYIISKKSYKDYYDGVAGSVGIDKTITYERHRQEFNVRKDKNAPKIFEFGKVVRWRNPIRWIKHISTKNTKYGYGYFLIGFCGKLYMGFKIVERQEGRVVNDTQCNFGDKLYITYDANEFMEKYHDKQNVWYDDEIINCCDELFKIDALELNREYKTPIWAFEDETFIVNPLLKNFDFFKMMDAFTAFQEISMFIGGVLGNKEKEIIQVSDKNKIEQHGFDYKWSFRKEK